MLFEFNHALGAVDHGSTLKLWKSDGIWLCYGVGSSKYILPKFQFLTNFHASYFGHEKS
jgi:hypothetical protein